MYYLFWYESYLRKNKKLNNNNKILLSYIHLISRYVSEFRNSVKKSKFAKIDFNAKIKDKGTCTP